MRATLSSTVRELFVRTDAKDLRIKSTQSIGVWWSRLQGRVLSEHMWKKALKNKGKRSKNRITSTNKTRQNKVCNITTNTYQMKPHANIKYLTEYYIGPLQH